MENKIDIATILKDCPRGMELDCTIYDGVTLDSVVFESEYHYENTNTYPIKITTKNGFSTRLTKYGQNVDIEEAKCVIFPKGKKTWEGFQRPFVDGDVIADDHGNIAIYKGTMWYNKKLADYYCGYRKSDDNFLIKTEKDGHFGFIEELHYASKEEKRKLFDVIDENDYEWDAENKTLVKKLKFKDGDIIADVYFNSICIFKGEGSIRGTVDFYCGISRISNSNELIIKDVKNHDEHFGEINKYNFATEEEKQKLFQTIESSGYKWNEKTKTLELIKPTFKDGDIVACGDFRDFCKSQIFIFKNKKENIALSSCYLMLDGDKLDLEGGMYYVTRFATGEEKNKLFKALKDNGYRWDFETNTLEKLVVPKFKNGDKIKHKECIGWSCTIRRVEDRYYVDGHPTSFTIPFDKQNEYELVLNKFDINTLKTFDQVLVRLTNNCVWTPKLFYYYDTDQKVKYYPFVTTDNIGYPQCIPYNGNEHLCRTTNNCDEFYRVWEE